MGDGDTMQNIMCNVCKQNIKAITARVPGSYIDWMKRFRSVVLHESHVFSKCTAIDRDEFMRVAMTM